MDHAIYKNYHFCSLPYLGQAQFDAVLELCIVRSFITRTSTVMTLFAARAETASSWLNHQSCEKVTHTSLHLCVMCHPDPDWDYEMRLRVTRMRYVGVIRPLDRSCLAGAPSGRSACQEREQVCVHTFNRRIVHGKYRTCIHYETIPMSKKIKQYDDLRFARMR
jgi:hypothetical protein